MPSTATTKDLNAAAAEASETARRATSEALGQVESAAHSLREKVEPTVARLASQAETLARRGYDAVLDGAHNARERAAQVNDRAVSYVKDEPVKAVLIAAATGAALMALVSLVRSARRSRY